MLYLLDASVLITAHNSYYPIDRVPEFWAWLRYIGEAGQVKLPIEFYEEVTEGGTPPRTDLLVPWLKAEESRTTLLLAEDVDFAAVRRVIDEGYASDLTDIEIEEIGRDPFLIAHALTDVSRRCVVTTEVSRPSRRRQNWHIPDVCGTFRVRCCDPFQMLKELNFTTGWRPS